MDICLQISYELMLNNPADKPRWISALIHLSCQRNHHINDHAQVTQVSVDLLSKPQSMSFLVITQHVRNPFGWPMSQLELVLDHLMDCAQGKSSLSGEDRWWDSGTGWS